MAFSSSIAIVFIGVTAYAVTAGPVQGISNTVQRDEYESPVWAEFVARDLDRTTNGRLKRNDDPYAYRPINIQHKRLLDLDNHLNQHSDSDEILGQKISVNGLHEIHNSPLNAETYGVENVNAGYFYIPQPPLVDHDVLDNAREHDGSLVKSRDDNLNVKNEFTRNLNQIGHIVRNPNHHDQKYRTLDHIGGGHLIRNLDQSGYYVNNLGNFDSVHIPGNLDHDGEHPDQIDYEDLVGTHAYSNVEARLVNQPGVASRRLDAGVASRNLDAAVASRNLDAAVASRKLDAAVASRRLDAAIASRKLDAAVASRRLDAAIASRKLNAAIASRQLQQAAIDSRRLQAAARTLSRLRTD